jgi:hypothetical protein
MEFSMKEIREGKISLLLLIIFDALSRAGTPDNLKNTIPNRAYKGLHSDIKIDKYGDAERKSFFLTIKDSRFVNL